MLFILFYTLFCFTTTAQANINCDINCFIEHLSFTLDLNYTYFNVYFPTADLYGIRITELQGTVDNEENPEQFTIYIGIETVNIEGNIEDSEEHNKIIGDYKATMNNIWLNVTIDLVTTLTETSTISKNTKVTFDFDLNLINSSIEFTTNEYANTWQKANIWSLNVAGNIASSGFGEVIQTIIKSQLESINKMLEKQLDKAFGLLKKDYNSRNTNLSKITWVTKKRNVEL
ncbi:hypothetical protein QTN25_004371 [Entamoeba marina]